LIPPLLYSKHLVYLYLTSIQLPIKSSCKPPTNPWQTELFTPLSYREGAPNGVGLLCETEEHGFRQKDKETYYLMT